MHQFGSCNRIHGTVLTDEFLILDDGGIKLDPHCLCVLCRTIAHLPVARVGCLATSEPDRGLQDPLVLRGRVVFQEDVLCTPETT